MMNDPSDKELLKFPKITHKSRSVPGNSRQVSNPHEGITSKAWFYISPHSQFGRDEVTQDSNRRPNERSLPSPR
jgi:hypothetical protein